MDNNVLEKMTNQEIVAHCMHEMTYNGFTQEAIASSLRALEEHISQSKRCDYYKQRIANNSGMADERILMDIIGEYVDTNSCFLESLIIDLLKSSRIEEDQLPLIDLYTPIITEIKPATEITIILKKLIHNITQPAMLYNHNIG